jgi:hypothetical protein
MSAAARKLPRTPRIALTAVLVVFSSSRPLFAQTTVGTGSIVGTVSDPSGAVVIKATITITNVAADRMISLATNSFGAYNSGALIPGNYRVHVSAKGFSSVDSSAIVMVGNTTTVNVSLQVGQQNQIVEVPGPGVRVNTDQPTVQGVLDQEQIENLP